MGYLKIKREERYTLITIEKDTADNVLFEQLFSRVVEEMEEGRLNFIFNFENIIDFNHSLYLKLNHINNIILKEGGILVIACFNAVNPDLFNDLDIISTKTVSEGGDYIIMEEIERQFMEVDDDDLEEDEMED